MLKVAGVTSCDCRADDGCRPAVPRAESPRRQRAGGRAAAAYARRRARARALRGREREAGAAVPQGAGTALPLQSIGLVEIGESPGPQRCTELLAPALAGHDLGVLSDAGCPGVADPGAPLVAAAHAAGITVVPLVGPSSLLLALMGSGMNGQRFAFHGYLPVQAQRAGRRAAPAGGGVGARRTGAGCSSRRRTGTRRCSVRWRRTAVPTPGCASPSTSRRQPNRSRR